MAVLVRAFTVMLLGLVTLYAHAVEDPTLDQAYRLVEDTTNEVMAVVQAADDYVDDDPERYYRQVEQILDPLIDYRGFARSVMGDYASSRRYRALDEAGREQLRDQLDRFTTAMRSSLVRTYSKGLLAFGGARTELAERDEDDPAAKRAIIKQLIYADRSTPYEMLYMMALEKSGEWKLRNVIIESVNLGEIYRDQFLASAREQDGDLDAVIRGWTVATVDVDG